MERPGTRAGCCGSSSAALTLAFLYVPLVVVVIYAFNKSRSGAWPPRCSRSWFTLAWHDPTLRPPF